MSTFSSTIRRILTKQTSMMTGVMTGRDPIDRDPGSQGSSAAGSQGSSAAGSQGSSAAGSQPSSRAGGLERAFELFAAAGIDFEVVPSCPVQTCEVCRQPPHLAVAA